MLTTKGFGEEASGRCLSRSARTGEEVAVRDPRTQNAVLKGANYVFLANKIAKSLAPIFSVEGYVGQRTLREAEACPQGQYRELRVAQRIDVPLLPSGPGGVRRTAAARFPADEFSTCSSE